MSDWFPAVSENASEALVATGGGLTATAAGVTAGMNTWSLCAILSQNSGANLETKNRDRKAATLIFFRVICLICLAGGACYAAGAVCSPSFSTAFNSTLALGLMIPGTYYIL